ncbi:hypothetical protein [Chlorobium sp.]
MMKRDDAIPEWISRRWSISADSYEISTDIFAAASTNQNET